MIIYIFLFIAVGASVLWLLHHIFFRHLTAPETINPIVIISRIAFQHKPSVIEYLRHVETKPSVPDHMRVISHLPEGMTDDFYQLTIFFVLTTIVVVLFAIEVGISKYISAKPSQKASTVYFFVFYILFFLCLYLALWCSAGAHHREGLEREYAETSGLSGVAERPRIE